MEYHYLEEKNKWGIIDTLGNIVVPLKYDKIRRNIFFLLGLFSVIKKKE